GDAALGASIGDSYHRALPGHPHGERLDLVDVDARVIPDPALGGAPVDVVVHPVAGEHLDGAVVHEHRKSHDQLALALPQDPGHAGIEPQHTGRDVELLLGEQPRIRTLTLGLVALP